MPLDHYVSQGHLKNFYSPLLGKFTLRVGAMGAGSAMAAYFTLGGVMTDEAKFNRFSISLKDFEKSEAFLAEAKKHQYGGLIHEALVFSAIICYFRPFTKNEKNQNSAAAAKLDLSDFPPLSLDELSIHNACKELRNEALAHAEIKHYPIRLDPETGIISSAIFSFVGKGPNLEALAELIKKFINLCRNKRADYVYAVRNAH